MTTPLVWTAAGALWLGCLLPGPWQLAVAGVLTAFVARAAAGFARVLIVIVALGLVGSGSAGARELLVDTGPLAALARTGGSAPLVGTVASEPRTNEAGTWFLVRIAQVNGLRDGRRALVRVDGPEKAPDLAATVAFDGTARPLDRNGFDGYLRRLHAAVAAAPLTPLRVVSEPPALIAATTSVRHRVRAATRQHLPTDQAALLSGLVTGDTTGMSQPALDSFLAAGLTHLVAVSGSNVALVLAGTLGIAGAAGMGARGRRRIAAVALVWFVILVRGEPSVLRAAVMAGLVLTSAAMGRGHDARHTLGVTVLLLLLIDPLLAGQLGFALSVLATAGVLVAGPWISASVPGPRPLATLVGASVGAQIAVAPVLLTMQKGIPLGSLPANLLAVPLAAVASAVGVTAALAAQVSIPAGGLIAAVAWPALSAVLAAGRRFSTAPAITPADLVTPSALLAVVAMWVRRRSPVMAVACVAAVVVTAVGAPWASAPQVEVLRLTALDVGQGDALLVEVPGGAGVPPARMLVDGGPEQSTALQLLRRRGVRFLDAVVASHPHADHTDGLPAILARVPTAAVLVGPVPPAQMDDPAASAVALEVVAAQQEVPVTRVHAGQRFRLGRASVEVLSPPADGSLGSEPNDNSLVLRVTDGQHSILLTGDAEEAAQRRLLQRPDLLAADVLKVPHHGGATNAEGFIDAVGAHTAVIGVGDDNDYGHPHPDVLADLAGTRILRTDTGGTSSATAE